MSIVTVRDLLSLTMFEDLPYGYRIYDYHTEKTVYDSEGLSEESHDEWLDYDVDSFDITEFGTLEINIDTGSD